MDCAAAATASGSADGAAPALASTLGRLAAATKVSPVEADDKSRPLVARPPASPRAVERVASDFVAWLDSRSERGGVLVVLLDGGPPALLYARASAALRKSAAAPRRRPDAFEETAPPNSGGWSLDAVHARFAARAAAVAERCRDAPSDAATRWRCSPGGADADETTFFAARSCAASPWPASSSTSQSRSAAAARRRATPPAGSSSWRSRDRSATRRPAPSCRARWLPSRRRRSRRRTPPPRRARPSGGASAGG